MHFLLQERIKSVYMTSFSIAFLKGFTYTHDSIVKTICINTNAAWRMPAASGWRCLFVKKHYMPAHTCIASFMPNVLLYPIRLVYVNNVYPFLVVVQ